MKLKILFLEDRENDVELASRILRKANIDFDMKQVDTRQEYETAIETYNPDVILSDHALPQFNSSQALSICQAKGINVPFILITGTVSEEFAAQCISQGADDYILKANLTRLPSAITNSLKKKSAEAAERNAVRQLKQSNIELSAANAELKKTNEELDAFVYSVSHNLRAPLTSVLGLLYLSKHQLAIGDISEIEKYHDMMEKSIEKLDVTLKQILDYSKNERTQTQFESVDLYKAAVESFESLKFMSAANNILFTISGDRGELWVSDRTRLLMILTNLFSNAIKYQDPNKQD